MHGAIRTTSTTRQDQGVSGALPLMFRGHRVIAQLTDSGAHSRLVQASGWSCCPGRRICSPPLKSQCSRAFWWCFGAVLRAYKAGGVVL